MGSISEDVLFAADADVLVVPPPRSDAVLRKSSLIPVRRPRHWVQTRPALN
ncbi:hypothetical protein LDDCCGHA_1320 [Methylobacterium oxalidis]|nr:hypothetical protein LDDCCGHA_1320 [Methylobacterium oxalidis]